MLLQKLPIMLKAGKEDKGWLHLTEPAGAGGFKSAHQTNLFRKNHHKHNLKPTIHHPVKLNWDQSHQSTKNLFTFRNILVWGSEETTIFIRSLRMRYLGSGINLEKLRISRTETFSLLKNKLVFKAAVTFIERINIFYIFDKTVTLSW